MSEPQGPFDAAIRELQKLITDPWDDQFWVAIRVLEVAPKIRETIVEFLEWGAMTGSDRSLFHEKFRALLEALPDGGKEKKG
jgi:hypothetical protein